MGKQSARSTRVETLCRRALLACCSALLACCAGARSIQQTQVLPSASASASAKQGALPTAPATRRPKVIVFVWDGLRPDSVTAQTTPNLARLRDRDGVSFSDQHAAYPTFTMMNAAAFATGSYPAAHGFYGNTEFQPGASGSNADGKAIDFAQPVFTEDHGVLQALDAFYRAQGGPGLFACDTLFQAAHRAGLRTAAIGKIGPAFMQDFRPDDALSAILDENIAAPLPFARGLQAAGFALPANTAHYGYGSALVLAPNNGKPSAAQVEKIVRMKDGATPDPRSALGSAHDSANHYLMGAYLEYLLPKLDPDLSFVWLRNPDSTEHQFGPGSANYLDALRDQDALLGQLQDKLAELGLQGSTDLIVVSDHGHSTVSGDASIFPLRALTGEADGHGELGALASDGYSVSGEVRSADLLTRAGFAHVYDGGSCVLDPVLSGVRKDGSLVYPTREGRDGHCAPKPITVTGAPPSVKDKLAPTQYSIPSYRTEKLEKDAILIAANGGSEYFYVRDQSPKTVRALVLALQERSVYGAIFVRGVYGDVPGTLPLSAIRAEGERSSPPTPDVIVSFSWDEAALAGGSGGLPGTEYASAQRYRGMHGSFSPRDVHNTLIAAGPHFKSGFVDTLPSGNVDVAPTVATLLGVHFDAPDGRVLDEALVGRRVSYRVQELERSSATVRLPRSCAADDPSCVRPTARTSYGVTLHEKALSAEGGQTAGQKVYIYLDRADVTRTRL
jgi:arylsulfatase A-like enzyme